MPKIKSLLVDDKFCLRSCKLSPYNQVHSVSISIDSSDIGKENVARWSKMRVSPAECYFLLPRWDTGRRGILCEVSFVIEAEYRAQETK